MRTNLKNRDVRFHMEDGCLVRTVTAGAGDGRRYTHRCCLEVYEQIAWVLDTTPRQGAGVAIGEIARAENLPHTQVDVTLAFLFERGIIDRRHRRNYPASDSVHLDAMVEWHALREEPRCARCGAGGASLIMSRFDTDMICAACEEREKAHPAYPAAAQAELDAVRRGEMNFPGVGRPAGL